MVPLLPTRLWYLTVSLFLCPFLSDGFKKITTRSIVSIDRAYKISSSIHRSTVRSESAEISKKLSSLRKERDIRRDQKAKADLAVQKAEIEYRNFRAANGHIEGSSFIPGTYDYGFNTQSNDILLVSKNSGVGGSTPAGIVQLATTNFKRELGREYCLLMLLYPLQFFPK